MAVKHVRIECRFMGALALVVRNVLVAPNGASWAVAAEENIRRRCPPMREHRMNIRIHVVVNGLYESTGFVELVCFIKGVWMLGPVRF